MFYDQDVGMTLKVRGRSLGEKQESVCACVKSVLEKAVWEKCAASERPVAGLALRSAKLADDRAVHFQVYFSYLSSILEGKCLGFLNSEK